MFFFLISPAFAEDQVFSIAGYYKNLFSHSKTVGTEESYYLDLNRLRLEFDLKPKDSPFEVFAAIDNEIYVNDFSDTPDFDLIRQQNQHNLAAWDAEKVSADKKHYLARHLIYRAYLKYTQSSFRATVGKQAIDWSRMRFYAPLDLFNQPSPLSLERDEKVGVDAVNLEYYFNPEFWLNLIAAPDNHADKANFGAKLFKKVKDYDLYLTGGEFQKNEVFGAGFDGYIFQAGFRGEVSYTHSDEFNRRDYFRSSVGLDYSPTPRLYLLTEYFYNGGAAGKNNLEEFLSSYKYSRNALSIEKNLWSFLISYEVTPLVKFDQYLIYDFDGKSVFFNPEIRYNVITNMDLSLGAQLYWGNGSSEFGEYQNVYYAQLKYFF